MQNVILSFIWDPQNHLELMTTQIMQFDDVLAAHKWRKHSRNVCYVVVKKKILNACVMNHQIIVTPKRPWKKRYDVYFRKKAGKQKYFLHNVNKQLTFKNNM